MDTVDDGRRGRNEIQVEFPFQPLFDDLQMQKAEETAAEAETESDGGLRLVEERRVVQLQFLQRVPKVTVSPTRVSCTFLIDAVR